MNQKHQIINRNFILKKVLGKLTITFLFLPFVKSPMKKGQKTKLSLSSDLSVWLYFFIGINPNLKVREIYCSSLTKTVVSEINFCSRETPSFVCSTSVEINERIRSIVCL